MPKKFDIKNNTKQVGIDASRDSFKYYDSGIYNDPNCGKKKGHAVTIVGYDSDGPGKDYYIVRNSWGKDWGNFCNLT